LRPYYFPADLYSNLFIIISFYTYFNRQCLLKDNIFNGGNKASI
jgi:hypothetical protein